MKKKLSQWFQTLTGSKDAQPAAPAPVEEPVAQEQQAPEIDYEASDRIRMAMDETANSFIASPDEKAHALADLLRDQLDKVTDVPCRYEGFDLCIANAVEQLPSLLLNDSDNAAREALSAIGAAVAARTHTPESIRKYEPTMATHYYKLLIICARGCLLTTEKEINEKEDELEQKRSLPREEQRLHRSLINTLAAALTSCYDYSDSLKEKIAEYEALLKEYEVMLRSPTIHAPVGPSITDVLRKKTHELNQAIEEMNRRRNESDEKLKAFVHEQEEVSIRSSMARKMHEQQMDEVEAVVEGLHNARRRTVREEPAIADPVVPPEDEPVASLPDEAEEISPVEQ